MSTFKDLQSWASKVKDEWETPDDVFAEMHRRYKFTLDVCASDLNHKLPAYFTKKQDGLKQPWSGHVCWMNPPYSDIGPWVAKCQTQLGFWNVTTVALLPMCSDTQWFHNHVYGVAQLHIVEGRLRFKGAPSTARFSSVIAVYAPDINPLEIKRISFKDTYDPDDHD